MQLEQICCQAVVMAPRRHAFSKSGPCSGFSHGITFAGLFSRTTRHSPSRTDCPETFISLSPTCMCTTRAPSSTLMIFPVALSAFRHRVKPTVNPAAFKAAARFRIAPVSLVSNMQVPAEDDVKALGGLASTAADHGDVKVLPHAVERRSTNS